MHCGWAAHSAIVAAQLVRRGFTGPPTVLEGRFGFFEAFLRGEADPDVVLRDLGSHWSVPEIFFKPYPANHFTHTAVDAGLALFHRGVRAEQVVGVRLGVPTSVVRTIGDPIETKRAPQTGYQAQFSGPYAVVAGLLGGGGGLAMGLDDYRDDLATDPARRALMERVVVVPDASCDAVFPHEFPAVVTVTLHDGTELTESVLTTRGGPRRPLSADELGLKFAMNCAGRLTPEAAGAVRGAVLRLGPERTGQPGPAAEPGEVMRRLGALTSPEAPRPTTPTAV